MMQMHYVFCAQSRSHLRLLGILNVGSVTDELNFKLNLI